MTIFKGCRPILLCNFDVCKAYDEGCDWPRELCGKVHNRTQHTLEVRRLPTWFQ